MTRTTAKYLAFLALSVILFHWKTMLTNQFTTIVGSEGVNQTYAWLHFWLNSLWHGHIPRWDPYTFAGRPFAGETQTTAFYPLRLLFAVVPLNRQGLVSPRFYHEYLAFNRFLAACFMFALMRANAGSKRTFRCVCRGVRFFHGRHVGQAAVAAPHGKLHLASSHSLFPLAGLARRIDTAISAGRGTQRILYRPVDTDGRRSIFADAGDCCRDRSLLLRGSYKAASRAVPVASTGANHSCGLRFRGRHRRRAAAAIVRIRALQSALHQRRRIPHVGKNTV